MLRERRAHNPSAMTLEGTRTFIVGDRQMAVVDPGPEDSSHLDAVAELTGNGVIVGILLTHEHPDHGGGADSLAALVDAPVLGMVRNSLHDGQIIATDVGDLVAVHTPGHTPDHACFHWPSARALFCGDLMMGGLDTALVAPPEGDLQMYLESLDRVRDLELAVIHPAHGPSFDDAAHAIDAYVRHRAQRQAQVLDVLISRSLTDREIADAVYGDTLPPGLEDVAASAVRAYLEHMQKAGSVVADGKVWRRVNG